MLNLTSAANGASPSSRPTLGGPRANASREGLISTVDGSLGSLARSQDCLDDTFYDTDHVSFNSDVDEAEFRRALLKDKWRQLFDLFDTEGFGEIPVEEFRRAISSQEFKTNVCSGKREILRHRLLDKCEGATGFVTFQDFVNVMSGKRTLSFKCAVHHREFGPVPGPPKGLFKRMVHMVAIEVLPDERDRKYYADRYTCCPPPLFLILITLVELGFFTYYTVTTGEAQAAGPVPIDSIFIYRPDKRHELWRFLLYMVLHAGWLHLCFNLAVQLAVGLPLEMVHGSSRVAAVYLAGVLAGSVGSSVFDPDVCLVGASGGVYALLAAHLANVMLNYASMQHGVARVVLIFAFASCDVGFAVYSRYSSIGAGVDVEATPPVSYVAHLTGALAGLTIGLLVLKNFEQKLHEQLLWWIALGVYAACTLFALLFNLLNTVKVQSMEMELMSEGHHFAFGDSGASQDSGGVLTKRLFSSYGV